MTEMTHPSYWTEAIEYLATGDRIMASLIASYPQEMIVKRQNPFGTLFRAIVGQQISVKAAATICARGESLLGGFSPARYLAVTEIELRKCGLSRPKIRYLTQIARALEDGLLTPLAWERMSDEEVAQQLMSLPGIGTWTAQMFLIFHLHRSDIFPLGDLGLVKAIELHYAGGNRLTKAQMEEISQGWKPYRTVATWYLWRSLDPIPVHY